MGCTASSPPRSAASKIANSKVIVAIKKRHLELNDSASKKDKLSFEKIILKFEKLKNSFKYLKKTFHDFADPATKSLDMPGLEIVLKHLNCEIDSENLVELFEYSDVDHSNKINLKEFLVALIVEYILGKLNISNVPFSESFFSLLETDISSNSSSKVIDHRGELQEMLDLIICAYLLFDTDGEGLIRKSSVEKIMEESGHKTGAKAMLGEQRWKEMVNQFIYSIKK
jgi:Ca2+-binding EF-hand superfamily protein